jgi:hypothetical protein
VNVEQLYVNMCVNRIYGQGITQSVQRTVQYSYISTSSITSTLRLPLYILSAVDAY